MLAANMRRLLVSVCRLRLYFIEHPAHSAGILVLSAIWLGTGRGTISILLARAQRALGG